MQYGFFDDAKREYVITKPDTPRPWSNYLGSTEYGAVITNHAGGYSFYRSGAQGRFTRLRFNSIPMDQPGRYFYIRDNEDGDFWATSWQPIGKSLEEYRYECRHGLGYTTIEAEYKGIKSNTSYFVPMGRLFECWTCELTNNSDKERELSLYTYMEMANDWNAYHDLVNLQYSQYIVKCDMVGENMLDISSVFNVPETPNDFQNRDQGRFAYMAMLGSKVTGYDTDREVFIGGYRTYADPISVANGECSNSLAYGDNACGSLQTKITLKSGESKKVLVVLGVGHADKEGAAVLKEYSDISKAEADLQAVKDYWHSKIGNFVTETPDAEFNSMVNVWNAYNCLITYMWSRAASFVYQGERDGLAYRDTVQDFLGVLPSMGAEVKDRLSLMLTGQFSTGGAKPVVKPFAHTPGKEELIDEKEYRSDDCLWLFNSIPAYVKETGDMGYYDEVLPYADKGEATVLGHLRRALEFNLERVGMHGLPCGLDADWNDCLRLGHKGESIFVTFQVRYGLTVYMDIAKRKTLDTEYKWAEETLADLDKKIQANTWDGEYFVRAYRDDGSVIGTKDDNEGSIFLNPQSWAVISGAAKKEQAEKAMDSVDEKLATEYGIMVCAPPFEKSSVSVVRAVLLNPGVKENAGIFSHPQGWAVIADTMLGHGSRAYKHYRAFMPSSFNTRAELREIEPYVHCQSTHSKYSRKFGKSRIPWLSGTATWSYYTATAYILGIRPEYEGLLIDPCLPKEWKNIKIDRVFRGKKFTISVNNESGKEKGVTSMSVNGVKVDGNLIPFDIMKDDNKVEVIIG